MLTYQAIVTRYLPHSAVKGSRVKATAAAGSVTLSWDNALNVEDNHRAAAEALAAKKGWKGHWHCGGMPSGSGNVYVCSDEPAFKIS